MKKNYIPEVDCEPVDVSYFNEVLPIIGGSCYSCHNTANAPSLGSGIDLQGYDNLKEFIENKRNVLLGSLKWNGQGEPMPDNGSKLDNCSINKIETWIDEGMQLN